MKRIVGTLREDVGTFLMEPRLMWPAT